MDDTWISRIVKIYFAGSLSFSISLKVKSWSGKRTHGVMRVIAQDVYVGPLAYIPNYQAFPPHFVINKMLGLITLNNDFIVYYHCRITLFIDKVLPGIQFLSYGPTNLLQCICAGLKLFGIFTLRRLCFIGYFHRFLHI